MAAVPVPDTVTDCGLLVALSVSVRDAALAPGACGLKATPMVQEELAGMLAPQVLEVTTKSAGFAPVNPTLVL